MNIKSSAQVTSNLAELLQQYLNTAYQDLQAILFHPAQPGPKLLPKPAWLKNLSRQAQSRNVPSIHLISLSKDITECTETNERQIVFGPFSDFSSSSLKCSAWEGPGLILGYKPFLNLYSKLPVSDIKVCYY